MLEEDYVDMKQVSNILKLRVNGKLIGRNELFKILRKKKVLQQGNNLPYRSFINLGYFKVKELTIERTGQYEKTCFKTTVSKLGIEFIKQLVK